MGQYQLMCIYNNFTQVLHLCFDLTRSEIESSIAFVLSNTHADVLTNITVRLNDLVADLIQL